MYCIKEIGEGQLELAAEVIRHSFATVARDFGLTEKNCPTNGAYIRRERLASEIGEGTVYYGLFSGDSLVGCAGIVPKDGGVFVLEKLSVLPEHRHRGYGTMLMDHVFETAKQRGGSKVCIGVIYENIQLKKWYMNYGFAETAQKTFPHLPFTVSYLEKEIL